MSEQGRNWSVSVLELTGCICTSRGELHVGPAAASRWGCLRPLKPQRMCYSALLALPSVDGLNVNSSVNLLSFCVRQLPSASEGKGPVRQLFVSTLMVLELLYSIQESEVTQTN